MQRVQTGIPDLDRMLGGGFFPGHSVLIAGAPGTGKTSLGMQFLHNGIVRFGEPGLFITFEEFPEQIYRDALNFGWDFRELESQGLLRVLFTSPDLLQQDIQREQGLVTTMIRELGAKRVVVDSISYFQRLIPEPGQFRETIYGIINALKREGLTSLLIRELTAAHSPGEGAEEFLTDAVIFLTRPEVADQSLRLLAIVKSRGSRHDPAPALLLIGDAGLEVIPAHHAPLFTYREAASVGNRQLDSLLGGGIPYGAFYLIELNALAPRWPLELSFIQEALAAGDLCVRLSARAPKLKDLLDLAERSGAHDAVQEGIKSRAFRMLHGQPNAASPASASVPRDLGLSSMVSDFALVCDSAAKGQKVRLLADLTDLISDMESATFFDGFYELLETVRCAGAVCLGFANPNAVEPLRLERLRAAADGLLRLWTMGAYQFLQVTKSVNAVRTEVLTLLETPQPPFFRIVSH